MLSYNIHKGYDWKNKNYFLAEMKELIRSSRADIVFLQEVVGKNEKFKNRGYIDSQFEYLADELWPHFSYAQNAVYDHGHHGNLILSKFPIETFENIDLSTNPWEKRGLLICKILIPKEYKIKVPFFYAACSHLNLLHGGRLLQYQKIKEQILLRGLNHPIQNIPFLIAGDFNDWNKKATNVFENELQMKEVHKSLHGNYAKSFPSLFPFLCLDRIYVKNMTIQKAHILNPLKRNKVLGHLSDHLPLYCEVEISES